MKYMQKPKIVDAVCIDFHTLPKNSSNTSITKAVTQTGEAFDDFPKWLQDAIKHHQIYTKSPFTWEIIIQTPLGKVSGHIGDYIVKDKAQQLSIWKNDVFENRFSKLLR